MGDRALSPTARALHAAAAKQIRRTVANDRKAREDAAVSLDTCILGARLSLEYPSGIVSLCKRDTERAVKEEEEATPLINCANAKKLALTAAADLCFHSADVFGPINHYSRVFGSSAFSIIPVSDLQRGNHVTW